MTNFVLRSAGSLRTGSRFKRIGAGDVEVSAGAGHGVQVNRHAEASAFGGDVAEEIILQHLVLGIGGRAHAVDAIGLRGVGGIEGQRAQVGGFEFFRDGSALLVAFQRGRHYARQVFGERGRRHAQAGLGEIAGAQFVFQGEEGLAVGVFRGEMRVVEGEDQGVGVRHPAKTRRLHRGSHGDAVGQHDLDAHLIEDPGGVSIAVLAFGGGLGFGGERRLEGAGTQGNGVGLRLHVVHRQGVELAVAGRGEHGVGVIVDGLDVGDLGGELRVHRGLLAAARGEQEGGGKE